MKSEKCCINTWRVKKGEFNDPHLAFYLFFDGLKADTVSVGMGF